MANRIQTSFDKQIFFLFPKDADEVELETFKISATQKERSSSYWRTKYNQFTIFEKESLDQEGNPIWRSIGIIDEGYFSEYFLSDTTRLYARQDENTGASILPEKKKKLIAEINQHIEKQRRERNKILQKERKQKNEALAKSKGLSVEDFMFQKKVQRMSKTQDKNVEKLKKQVSLVFKYNDELDKLEKEIAKAREVLGTIELEKLALRDNMHQFQWKIRDMKNALSYYIKLKNDEEKK
jgi:hypothetical protein